VQRRSAASRKKRKSKGKRQKSKGKNLCAEPWAGLGKDPRALAANKTIVNDAIGNDSILDRRRKPATTRNLRGAQKKAESGLEVPGLDR